MKFAVYNAQGVRMIGGANTLEEAQYWARVGNAQAAPGQKVQPYHGGCERCEAFDEEHGPHCPNHPDHDPTPWCSGCGARREKDCHCGPIARND